jgi:uncharacterized protein YdhG (YjbR/CyaY superfamily)
MSNDVDDYPDETRPALEQLRKSIRAAAPKATEKISYQIPTFEYLGPLVAYAAFKRHCGLYVMSSGVIEAHQEELAPYDTAKTKTTIRFAPDRPLPAALVRKLVKARIAENEQRTK